jgi:hypothetical protein
MDVIDSDGLQALGVVFSALMSIQGYSRFPQYLDEFSTQSN